MPDLPFRGPYADADHAPVMGLGRCFCPLNCPVHGENGPIPGDMMKPAQVWEGLEVRKPGAPAPYLGISNLPPGQAPAVETVTMGPAPVGTDGVIGNGMARPAHTIPVGPDQYPPGEWAPVQQAPMQVQQVYQTPPAIIPVEIPDAVEQLTAAGIKILENGENIDVVYNDGYYVRIPFELANCLAQEILNARKRIELTLPETIDSTLEIMKKRLGPDMAALVDLIKKGLSQNPGQGSE